jgi:hypothetical protein
MEFEWNLFGKWLEINNMESFLVAIYRNHARLYISWRHNHSTREASAATAASFKSAYRTSDLDSKSQDTGFGETGPEVTGLRSARRVPPATDRVSNKQWLDN